MDEGFTSVFKCFFSQINLKLCWRLFRRKRKY